MTEPPAEEKKGNEESEDDEGQDEDDKDNELGTQRSNYTRQNGKGSKRRKNEEPRPELGVCSR